LALPESNRPLEFVDGEVVMPPSPSLWHQEILSRLVVALRTWALSAPEPVTVVQAPVDVRFAAGRILQPDAMVFLATLERDLRTPLDRIPEICIEVLSSNRTPAGVVERRSGPGLARVEELEPQILSPLLPGFTFESSDLFG